MGKVQELHAYEKGFKLSMMIFGRTKKFPVEEKYSLTDQVRCSSRSVVVNLAEAYLRSRTQRYFEAELNTMGPNFAKHRYGWNLHWPASTSLKKNTMNSSRCPKRLAVCFTTWPRTPRSSFDSLGNRLLLELTTHSTSDPRRIQA